MLYWCKDCKSVIRYKKFLQSILFCLFFRLCKLSPEILEALLEFPFRGFRFRKYNKSILLRKHKKFFWVSVSWKFSRGGFLLFFDFGVKSAGLHLRKYKKSFLLIKCKKKLFLRKYKKSFLLRKYKIFFNIRAKSFISWNMRNFWGYGFFFYFFGLGLGSVPGVSWNHCLSM